jgi:hypothetical protein
MKPKTKKLLWAAGGAVAVGGLWYYFVRDEFAGLSMSELRYIRAAFGPGSEIESAFDGIYQGVPARAVMGTTMGGAVYTFVYPLAGSVSQGKVVPYVLTSDVKGIMVKV